jgi:hypothetical protein
MLTPQEQSIVVHQKATKETCQKITGIIFQSPQNWSLWIDGEKFTPARNKSDSFEIQNISSEYVSLKFSKEIKKFSIHDSFDVIYGTLCE